MLSHKDALHTLQTHLRNMLILPSHLRIVLPSGLFPSAFPIKTLCALLFTPIHATCPAHQIFLNLLTPNVDYSGRTAPLTSKCCILYIYSTNIVTENFKHGIYSPFFPLINAVCFINLTYLVPALFTFYIQGVLKLKK